MKYPLYRFTRKIINFFVHFCYRVEYLNKENIPTKGPFILAGNHKSNLDCLLLISSTNMTIRFMAKAELMKHFGWLFKRMGIIPVNRKTKNKEALEEAYNVLRNNGVIGIFPEGTFNKSEYLILPFKYGSVKMAKVTNTPIIPFAIINDYRLFRKSVKIVFGKPYFVNDNDLTKENIILMNKVINLLKEKEKSVF